MTALEAIQGVLDLMQTSQLHPDSNPPDAIYAYSNGYGTWMIGPPNFGRRRELKHTTPLTAEQILALIEARAVAG